MVAGEPAFDVCKLGTAFEGNVQPIRVQRLGRHGVGLYDLVPERLLLDAGQDRPGVPMECVSDRRVIRPPASPAEHGFPQLPAADPGDHIQVARDHHDPSSDRYLLAGHAIWQPFSVPVLELIPERAEDRKSTRLNSSHGYIS